MPKPQETAEKPAFSVVPPAGTAAPPGIKPPRPLGEQGTALWDAILREYRIDDRGGLELLAQACAALDRAEQLAAAIQADGAVVYSRTGVPKAHPAARDELGLRSFVVRTLERLGVTTETPRPGPGRPPTKNYWDGGR